MKNFADLGGCYPSRLSASVDNTFLDLHYSSYPTQPYSVIAKRFSFECRKVIGIAFATLRDWLKRFAPLFHSIRSKTKTNRPFSKMAAENLNKSKLKTNTSTRKSTLILITLPSFSISGEISAEKM